MPNDWDVLGILPPRKRPKVGPTPLSKSTKTDDQPQPPLGPPEKSATPNPRNPQSRFPKHRIPLAPKEGLSDQVARLAREIAEQRAFADEKVRALTVFGAHQDNALWLLPHKFEALKLEHHEEVREQLERDINAILEESDNAVITLRERFPSLEARLAQHDDTDNFSTTAALRECQDYRVWHTGAPLGLVCFS